MNHLIKCANGHLLKNGAGHLVNKPNHTITYIDSSLGRVTTVLYYHPSHGIWSETPPALDYGNVALRYSEGVWTVEHVGEGFDDPPLQVYQQDTPDESPVGTYSKIEEHYPSWTWTNVVVTR